MPRRSTSALAGPAGKASVERLLHIHNAVQAGKYPNSRSLARELEVTQRCIEGDIAFMRDRLQLPIVYDPLRWGYFYSEEVGAFPSLQITEGEILALIIAEKALQQYRGTNFERPLLSAVEKLASTMPEVTVRLDQFNDAISFRTRVEAAVPREVFETLMRAARQGEQLELVYRKPGGAASECRIVDPYHLANINAEWFLFAYCHLRKDIRTFVPSRVQQVRLTGKTFIRPKNFSVEASLKNSFGVLSGKERHNVRIRFSPAVADYIREKTWHPSQKLTPRRDGGVELAMTLSSLVEVQKWILSWGADARALAPAALIKAVQATARQILSAYTGRP